MPYLVRWNTEGTPATLRCVNVETGGFLPNHVKLTNVQGIHDNAHPDLSVQSIYILRSEIVYVAEADLKDTKPDPVEAKPDPLTEPDTPKPAPTKRKRKSTKKA